MNMRFFVLTVMTAFSLFVLGCDRVVKENRLTEEEKTKILKIQNPFGADRYEVPREKGLFLGVKDCDIYRSVSEGNVIVAWEKSLSAPFYPFGVCSRYEITIEDDYVHAFLCVLGLGAGGGCSAGGNYRTMDGHHWEKEEKGKWVKEE